MILPIVTEETPTTSAPARRPMRGSQDLKWPPIWSGSAWARTGIPRRSFPAPISTKRSTGPRRAARSGVMPDPLPAEAPVARVTLSRAAILSARALIARRLRPGEARGASERAIEDGPLVSRTPIGRVLAEAERSDRHPLERDMTLHPAQSRCRHRPDRRAIPPDARRLSRPDRARARIGRGSPEALLRQPRARLRRGGEDKAAIRDGRAMNIGIVTAYNDMLSAHQPYGRYPEQMKLFAREVGATAQVAGGVPAMCDGVTQGQRGMELSLFSRDTIALSTAVALSHGMFEGAALLGICDKIVPGLLIGALRFGHLPTILIPAGPMPSGLANKEKRAVRELYAEGKVGRDGTARGGDRLLSRRRHLHLLRHRQFQPDDDGGDGPAHARRRLRQSRHASCARN